MTKKKEGEKDRIGDKAKRAFSSSTCVCTPTTVAKITVRTKKMQSLHLYDQTLWVDAHNTPSLYCKPVMC